MAIKDRIKSAVENVKSRASGASERARESAREAELSPEQKQAAAQARERAAAAARAAVARANTDTSPTGTTIGPSSNMTRTQKMFARAEQAATAGAPVQASLDPTPNEMGMWEFASAGNNGQPTSAGTNSSGGGADWGDNPDHLDTAEEVREDLRADGLDPMEAATQQQAQFGHMLVHDLQDDPGRGGRTAEQLEAEHDMTVAAMTGFGANHHTPMDTHPFQFSDPFGAASGESTADETEGWF